MGSCIGRTAQKSLFPFSVSRLVVVSIAWPRKPGRHGMDDTQEIMGPAPPGWHRTPRPPCGSAIGRPE